MALYSSHVIAQFTQHPNPTLKCEVHRIWSEAAANAGSNNPRGDADTEVYHHNT